MRRRAAWLSLLVMIAALLAAAPAAWGECSTDSLPAGRQVAELQTSVGQLCIELLDDVDEAPGHVENFLYYLDSGNLEGTFFHRLVPDFIVQGGEWFVGPEHAEQVTKRDDVEVINEPCTLDIPAEDPTSCSERGNEAYTVALGKLTGMPNSGSMSWFINLADNRTHLDHDNGGFTVFGRLLDASSIATAERMGAAPVADTEDHFWMRTGFAYEWVDEGQGLFQLPDHSVPLSDSKPWASPDYGCLDMRELSTLILTDDLPQLVLDPNDPETPRPAFHTASAACGELVEDSAGWVPSGGTAECPTPGRLAVRTHTPRPTDDPNAIEYPTAPLPAEYVSFTCEQLLESDTERANWRNDFEGLLIEIESATVSVAVPEPGGLTSALAALASLGWLRRVRQKDVRFATGGVLPQPARPAGE